MLKVENLSKEYTTPNGPLRILSNISFNLEPGSAISIMGPSGSGKSTLLYILGALEPPSSGLVSLDSLNPFSLRPKELAAFRNRQLGFIFQDHCLLPQCSVIENVLTPTLVAERNGDVTARARDLLKRVGLGERIDHRPAQLSGGEKQRTALARALIMKPRLLLCDEPTGNLDRKSADVVAELLLEVVDSDTSLIVVTHSPELASRCPRTLELRDGCLQEAK
ncbi:MAG TPA: ABC transporter ATP-binding protein [Pyrinomonadaceae bacterium]|nr:ABC transporter ATP-binding protein [Pyrinomonadaceae bacterium]